MKDKLLILVVVLLASLAIAGLAGAQGDIQTLYPSYRLVNTDGELVFEAWLIEADNKSCIQMSNGNFFCCCEAGCTIEEIEVLETVVPKDPTSTPASPTDTPVIPPTSTPKPPDTPEPKTFCHCEQGEGEGAKDRKNCHDAKYNNGHAKHEWDYWSETGTCEGWNH